MPLDTRTSPCWLADLDDVSNLTDKHKELVASVYHSFRSICMSPDFTLADWWLLYHFDNVDDPLDLTKDGGIDSGGKT